MDNRKVIIVYIVSLVVLGLVAFIQWYTSKVEADLMLILAIIILVVSKFVVKRYKKR